MTLLDSLILPLFLTSVGSITLRSIIDLKLWGKICYLERLFRFVTKKYHPDFTDFETLK